MFLRARITRESMIFHRVQSRSSVLSRNAQSAGSLNLECMFAPCVFALRPNFRREKINCVLIRGWKESKAGGGIAITLRQRICGNHRSESLRARRLIRCKLYNCPRVSPLEARPQLIPLKTLVLCRGKNDITERHTESLTNIPKYLFLSNNVYLLIHRSHLYESPMHWEKKIINVAKIIVTFDADCIFF